MSMRFSPLYHIKIEPRLCMPIAKLQVKLQNFRKLFQIHCPIFLISTLIARQIKPKEIQTCGCIQTWRCIAKTLNQLSCIASAVTECCRIQQRAICKFLSWCQSKLKQSHGVKQCWQKKKKSGSLLPSVLEPKPSSAPCYSRRFCSSLFPGVGKS